METGDVFGIIGQSLKLREKRASILATNLVQSSTPGYKARDFDFHQILKQQQNNSVGQLKTTNAKHIGFEPLSLHSADLQYRVPNQPSLDGNTVDNDLERVAFMENAMQYQVNLTFLRRKHAGLMKAIRGE